MLNKYFRQSSRKKMETMSDYIVRKTDVYNIKKHAKPYRGSSNTMSQGRSGKLNMENHGTGRTMAGPTVAGSSGIAHGNKNKDQIRLKRTMQTENQVIDKVTMRGKLRRRIKSPASREESYATGHGPSGSWSAYRGTSDSWSHTQEAEAWTLSTPELLPDFLQGWVHADRRRDWIAMKRT